jgi:multicomponent Na+:H+ antiporter subunit F
MAETAELILKLAFGLIFIGVALGVIRLVKGETTVDRVIAMDLLTIIAISLIVLVAHVAGRFIYVDVAVVYALLSFLGVMAVARCLEQGI